MATDPDPKAQMLADWEARPRPVGFYNLALSYLEGADVLTDRIHASYEKNRPELIFDSPVRHLYALTWELALKACLFTQGISPFKLKKNFGHNILKVWKPVDKERFPQLSLVPDTQVIADYLGLYHYAMGGRE